MNNVKKYHLHIAEDNPKFMAFFVTLTFDQGQWICIRNTVSSSGKYLLPVRLKSLKTKQSDFLDIPMSDLQTLTVTLSFELPTSVLHATYCLNIMNKCAHLLQCPSLHEHAL